MGDARLARLLGGDRRNYRDTPARSARAKAIVQRTRPWERGRIGNIEKRISREGTFANKLFETGELARAIYCNPDYDQNYRPREAPPPKLKSWMLARIRRAAPTFCDRVGRSTGRGRAWLWRIRPDYWWEVRRAKEAQKPGHRQGNP